MLGEFCHLCSLGYYMIYQIMERIIKISEHKFMSSMLNISLKLTLLQSQACLYCWEWEFLNQHHILNLMNMFSILHSLSWMQQYLDHWMSEYSTSWFPTQMDSFTRHTVLDWLLLEHDFYYAVTRHWCESFTSVVWALQTTAATLKSDKSDVQHWIFENKEITL